MAPFERSGRDRERFRAHVRNAATSCEAGAIARPGSYARRVAAVRNANRFRSGTVASWSSIQAANSSKSRGRHSTAHVLFLNIHGRRSEPQQEAAAGRRRCLPIRPRRAFRPPLYHQRRVVIFWEERCCNCAEFSHADVLRIANSGASTPLALWWLRFLSETVILRTLSLS